MIIFNQGKTILFNLCFKEEEVEHYTQHLEDLESQVQLSSSGSEKIYRDQISQILISRAENPWIFELSSRRAAIAEPF